MTNILTLSIKLSGKRESIDGWLAAIEVTDVSTLLDLHYTIQELVQFDNDHLYDFYVGRTWRQRKFVLGESESPFDASNYDDCPLSEVYPLEKKHKLFYHFDFGDDWIFEIRKHRGAKAMNLRRKYPRLIEKSGRRPRQYRGY